MHLSHLSSRVTPQMRAGRALPQRAGAPILDSSIRCQPSDNVERPCLFPAQGLEGQARRQVPEVAGGGAHGHWGFARVARPLASPPTRPHLGCWCNSQARRLLCALPGTSRCLSKECRPSCAIPGRLCFCDWRPDAAARPLQCGARMRVRESLRALLILQASMMMPGLLDLRGHQSHVSA